MSLQGFLLKQYASWKLKKLPKDQREQMVGMVERDPQLFKKIGEEIEKRKKGGESETKASIEVMKKYRTELAELMPASPAGNPRR